MKFSAKRSKPLRSRSRSYARRSFRQASRTWVLQTSRSITSCRLEEELKTQSSFDTEQPDLFGISGVAEVYVAPKRYPPSRKNKRSHRKLGLQYKMRLRVRDTDRVSAFRSKDNSDHRLTNDETGAWSKEGLLKLHQVLLHESISAAKRCDELSYNTHAEIWLWINRVNADDSFSFIRCCEVANVDPDVMRPMIKRFVQDNQPHIDLLRRSIIAAESGDPDAIAWCLSDAKGPLSFSDTCRAAGFTVKQARAELKLSVVNSTPASAAA